MPTGAKLTEEQKGEIVALYQDGLTLSAIASRINICVATVSYLLTHEGIKRRRRCKLSEEQQEQEQVVQLYDEGLSLTTIADMFRVSRSVITGVLKRKGRKRSSGMSARELTERQQKEIVKMYQEGMSLRAIAGKFPISYGTARRLLQQKGVELRPRLEAVNKALTRHNFNANYFDLIDTEEKAYWIGFIMADGNVSYRKGTTYYRFSMALKTTDIDHLVKLRATLNSTHKIYTRNTPIPRLNFSNEHFCKTLIKHGVVPRKSYKELVPPQMPDELLRHFWRGYFDGDGSLHLYKNNTRKDGSRQKSWGFNLLGSRSLLESFVEWVWSQGFLVRRPTLHPTRPNCKTLDLKLRRKSDIRNVTKAFYEGATVYLDRKMEKYQQLKSSEVSDDQLNLPLLDTKTTK